MERRAKKPNVEDNSPNKKIRLGEDVLSDSEASSSSTELKPSTTLSKDALAMIPGVKQQARYVPAVNMSKEELTMWRKEARRVRNRESAAASRQKTQSRITELEEEVGFVTNKYEAALRRIVELEAAAVAGNSHEAWKPTKNVPQHSDAPSPLRRATYTVSPPLSPRESFSLDEDSMPELKTAYYPHSAITKISCHNACVRIPYRVVVASL